MPLGKKTLLASTALAAAFLLLGVSNGIVWSFKGTNSAWYIARWELVNYGVGLAAGLLLFAAYGLVGRRVSGTRLVAVAAALSCAGGMLWRLAAQLALWDAHLTPTLQIDPATVLVRGGLMDGPTLGLLSFLHFGIEHWRQAAEQREKAREAMALAHQAQLQMLRYQLNPHFLFNALNLIRGLILDEPARSREVVTELADFLRYSLDGRGTESAIADEIRAIDSYLAIQRIRFESQLDATVSVQDSALDVAVPCFLIHPLVENAVKYGMKTSPLPLRLRIDVRRLGDEVAIRVSNTGRLLDRADEESGGDEREGGIGLKNIRERLKLVFPDRHTFSLTELDGWVHAEITLRLSGGTQDPGTMARGLGLEKEGAAT